MLVTIAASFVLSLPFADVCLTPASRGGDVGQAPVPSLDAQVVESRRGHARRVAGFLFSLFSVSAFSAASSFSSLSPSRSLVTKNPPKKNY